MFEYRQNEPHYNARIFIVRFLLFILSFYSVTSELYFPVFWDIRWWGSCSSMASHSVRADRHFDLKKLLTRPSAFDNASLVHPQVRAGDAFNPLSAVKAVQDAKIAVIGAGGLGCELLKNLALSGFQDISVVDADEIDVTNLNRQFLFRKKDVGKSKAETASAFVKSRITGLKMQTYNCFIQKAEDNYDDFDFEDFDLVINGLDNLKARTWVSEKLMTLVQYNADGTPNADTITPLVDGGTEGYDGQVHIVIPYFTQDFAGRSWMFPKRKTIATCTLASSPRKPEHCVLWVMEGTEKGCWKHLANKKVRDGEWKAVNDMGDGRKFDTDNANDMKWITHRSIERAQKFNLDKGTPLGAGFEVAYFYVLGVVKSIIPAVGSTNAMIAALSVIEAIKIISKCSHITDNFAYIGGGAGFSNQLESIVLDDFTNLPIRMWFPADGKMTVRQLEESIANNFSLNGVLFKYSVNIFNHHNKPKPAGRTSEAIDRGRVIPVHIAHYENSSEGFKLVHNDNTMTIGVGDFRTVKELKTYLKNCLSYASQPLSGKHLVSSSDVDFFLGRYSEAEAQREAGGKELSRLSYHGIWLYANDEAELDLDASSSRLYVIPKLPEVSLQGLDNNVPMGNHVKDKSLAELGAKHGNEFMLTRILRASHKAGEAPRDVVLLLYLDNLDCDSVGTSSSDDDSESNGNGNE